MITTLEIGSIVIPSQSLLEFSQTYSDINGQTIRRTAAGGAVLRRLWGDKVSTTVSGKGWIPSAFENLDTSTTHALKCAVPRSASSSTTTVAVPANRRSDAGHTVTGHALVGDELVDSVITNQAAIDSGASDSAVLTVVSGATGYRVDYFPLITVIVTAHDCKGDSAANYEWEFEAEQI